MNVLLLSFYYPPDLSACSFRMKSVVEALLEELSEDSHIDLITTLPNRYRSFSRDVPTLEEHPRLTIHRVELRAHRSGMLDQSMAYLGYARAVRRLVKDKRYDRVFATSSRLMTAVLGAYVARRIREPLYLDVRDIFVDTIGDIFPRKIKWLLKPSMSVLERWAIRSASRVNLVSEGFLPYFKDRYPEQRFSFYSNGIDECFLDCEPNGPKTSGQPPFQVVYAGNMGEGQGLHAVIPALAAQMGGLVDFLLVGDGGRKRQLIEAVAAAGCRNVRIIEPVERDELVRIYQSADVLFLHLNDYEAFKKVLPSKLFEYGAIGKPIWAGVSGYAARFIKENIDNVAVFEPCNAADARRAFSNLVMETRPRKSFSLRFSRSAIARSMVEDFLATRHVRNGS